MQNSYRKFILIFTIIILAVGGGYFVWNRFFDEGARANRFLNKQLEVYEKAEKAYVEAMTADTYGGKTPQETLDMFVDALKKGDVELASKYFLLDENLSREQWFLKISEVKSKGLLAQLVEAIESAVPDTDDSISENDLKYVLLTNGVAEATLRMKLNQYAGIWKIESL